MPVSTTESRIAYAGDGVSTDFAFPYEFLLSSDLKVIKKVTATGVETTLVEGTDYDVTGGNGASGTVACAVAPAAGVTLTLYNDPPKTQGLDLEEGDASPALSKEHAWDKLTFITQRLSDRMDRAIGLSEGYSSTFNPVLPSLLHRGGVLFVDNTITGIDCGPGTAASRAGKYLRFDTNGDPYVVDFPTPAGTLVVSAFAETILDDSNAQAVRNTIGAARVVAAVVTEDAYGAVGNGIVDDSTAIQAAINAVSAAGGGIVEFPVGTYLLGTELLVPDYVFLRGVSRFTCKLYANTNSMNIIHHTGSYGGAENLGCYGNGKTGVTGLRVTPVSETQTVTQVQNNFNLFRNMHFNSLADGIVMRCGPDVGGSDSGCWYNTFESCDMLFCTRALWLKDGPNASSSGVNRNKFIALRMGGAGSNTGVQIDSGGTNSFFGCDFEGIASGVLPNATPTAIKIADTGTFSGANNGNRFFGCQEEACTRAVNNANAYTEFHGCDLAPILYTALPVYQWGGSAASQMPMVTPPFVFQGNSQIAGYNNNEIHLIFGKINFPDVQIPSTDVNTLDDYEEGTFTPAFNADGGSGYTYSVQKGFYTKIGKKVFFEISITLTGGTLGTTNARIEGLPFAALGTSGYGPIFNVLYDNATGLIAGDSIRGSVSPSDTHVGLFKQNANAYGTLSAANITTGFAVFVTGQYEATA